jgi:hypothetical protein
MPRGAVRGGVARVTIKADDIAAIPSLQNRAHESPRTRLKQLMAHYDADRRKSFTV